MIAWTITAALYVIGALGMFQSVMMITKQNPGVMVTNPTVLAYASAILWPIIVLLALVVGDDDE